MHDAATIQVGIRVTIVIVQRWNSARGSDDAALADDMRAEPRTRQQHAATDPAGTSSADG